MDSVKAQGGEVKAIVRIVEGDEVRFQAFGGRRFRKCKQVFENTVPDT